MSKKAALYIRVSTDAQREEGYSIEAQKEMLISYCKTKDIKSYEFYIDGGFTGSNMDRPELSRMIKDIKDGKISHVVVYKLDRLSRSQKDALYLIEDVLGPHNVDFTSMNESMDTGTPMGRLMLGILAAFAQLERENIKERTRMGMKERIKNGYWMGGGRVPFGYDYDSEQGILVPNKDAETVRKIYDLYLKGYSREKIAELIGFKYDKLVSNILMRKANAGFIVYNDEEYLGRHEPIISLETYERAMEMMRNRSFSPSASGEYLLTGLLECGNCSAKMRYQKWGKSGVKIICYSQQKSKPYLIKNPDCQNHKYWADEIEDIVIKDICRLSVKDIAPKKNKDYSSSIDLLQKQYDLLSGKIKRLYNLYAESEDRLLLSTIEENQQSLSDLRSQIAKEQRRRESDSKDLITVQAVENIKQMWKHMTTREKQLAIRQCVSKVVLKNGDVEVYYNL